uniref:Serine racemase n=1 Tax=Timema tahoe TaxID=61484 RepID=A0A7R9ING6_9NEOP|nr:unnamed protein product [Timema tahoe]
MEVYLKKDFLQYTGSFKERGARYALLMLSDEKKMKGVISASLGNHALALCYHGKDLKIPVTVVMPIVAPIMKIQSCRQHGASVVVQGDDMGEAKRIAMQLAKERELTYINGYDHPHIMAGQGTLGLEIVEQVPNIDAVVVPVGGGGLIAGVALAVKTLFPHIKIIGVESERCASFSKAVKAGMPVYTKIESTLADGLAVPMVGYNAFATAAPLIDKLVSCLTTPKSKDIFSTELSTDGKRWLATTSKVHCNGSENSAFFGTRTGYKYMAISSMSSPITDVRVENSTGLITVPIPFAGCSGVVVKEEWIAIAILRLVELEKCVVEGAGAAGLAAILAGHLDEMKGKRVVLPLCGGNIDTTILGRCLERGLAVDGRLLKFTVTVSDRPGGIAELCRLLSSLGVSIKDIMHERAWIQSDIFSVKVKVVCETRDMSHANQLKQLLYDNYNTVSFGKIPSPMSLDDLDCDPSDEV